jgi:hypothetical protein
MAQSEQDVANAIQAALRVVDEAAVPDDLRALAFEKAFNSLTATVPQPSTETTSQGNAAESRSGTEDSPVGRAAARLRVEPESIERVLDFDEDGVHIMAPRSRFPKQKSAAIQQVATLVVGTRQAAGLDEEWTPQGLVRDATERLGVEDPSNFATHMKKLEGIRARGSGKSGELRMNAVGFEAAGNLIRQLAQEGRHE